MRASFQYFDLDGTACRVAQAQEGLGVAEMYIPGTGFVPTEKMEVLFQGRPMNRQEFDRRLLKRGEVKS